MWGREGRRTGGEIKGKKEVRRKGRDGGRRKGY